MGIPEPIRKEIIKALRSGEYQQTKNLLLNKTPKGKTFYCASGVVCDVISKLPDSKFRWKTFGSYWHFGQEESWSWAYPTWPVSQFLGVDPKWFKALTVLNDEGCLSLGNIADFLERFTDDEIAELDQLSLVRWTPPGAVEPKQK